MAERTVVYRLQAEVARFQAGMAQASASTKKLAGDLTGMDKSSIRTRASLTQLGGTAGKIGLVAAAGLGAAVVTAANFDAKMSEIQAATGETAAGMDKLRAAALKAGADTAFSAGEAADGVTELAKAGVSTSDILSGGLTGALSLAAAGQIEVGEAAEYSAKAMSQFSLAGDQVPHVADLLAAAAGKAVGEVGDFGQALNQVGLVASTTGLSIEDTVGTLAAFSQAGLSGSDAGTAFKSMLQRLQNPLGKGAAAMEEFGINAYDTQGNFVGITEVAGQLQTQFEGVDQATRDAAFAQIFGSDAVRAATVLYREGATGIGDWIDQTDDAGFAAEQAAAKLDNLKGDLEALMGSLETALIGTGDGAQGPLRSLTQNATDAVNVYNKLPSSIQGATASALGLVAVTGGAAWFGSKVIQSVANTRFALQELGVTSGKTAGSLGKVAKTGGGILLVAGAVTMLGNALAKATGATIDSADLARDLEALAGGGGEDILSRITNDLDILGQTSGKITEPLKEVVTAFGLFGNTGKDNAADNIEQVDQQLASLVESGNAEQAATLIAQIAEASGKSTSELEDDFASYNTALRNAGLVTGLLTPVSAALTGVQKGLAGATNGVKTAAQNEAQALRDSVQAMQEKRAAALGAFDAETAYRQALVAARQAANKNTAGIQGNSEAALDNRSKLSALAGAWNDLTNKAQNTPGRLKAARNAFIQTATDMGVPRQAAEALARQLLEIPNKVSTDVTVNTGQAMSSISQVDRWLSILDGKRATTYIDTIRTGARTVPGLQMATGGAVSGPGTATSDSIPLWGSDGEFMMRAAAVDKYGANFMQDVNALRLAEGGMVQRYAQSGGSSQRVSFDRAQVDIRTPDGRVQTVELMARVADDRINAARRHDTDVMGRHG